MRILVTGGAGYIGTHTVLVLVNAGHSCLVVDNLSNACVVGLDRVKELTGKGDQIDFEKVDLTDKEALEGVFTREQTKNGKTFDACIHFAGLKAVGESVSKPLEYFHNNTTGAIFLLQLLDKYDCRKIVFSSSATVYGDPDGDSANITEDFSLRVTNPYGRTKLQIEDILRDCAVAKPKEWKIVILRYFNPIGAHPSGMIGEDPNGIPNNLFPYILQVAIGKREHLGVFGNDYDTVDGTGVRDYIHVMDLAEGHLAALVEGIYGDGLGDSDCEAFNLGTGNGSSVLEMLAAVGKACGKELPHKILPRRPGDIARCVCKPTKALERLKWKASRNIEVATKDGWTWQEKNPQGFAGEETGA